MDYILLKKRIETIASGIQQVGGEVQEVVIGEPISIEQITKVENRLGVKLPKSFKKVLTEFSSHFNLCWDLPDNLERPKEFRKIFSGRPNWNLEFVEQFEKERMSWIENVFPDSKDEYGGVWHNKLAFCEVGNGDFLAFDMKDGNDASIVYLSHDDGEGHGYKLANNFIELIDDWSRLGFVGCEGEQWIPFTTSPQSGIKADGEVAQRFRTWLGLII